MVRVDPRLDNNLKREVSQQSDEPDESLALGDRRKDTKQSQYLPQGGQHTEAQARHWYLVVSTQKNVFLDTN